MHLQPIAMKTSQGILLMLEQELLLAHTSKPLLCILVRGANFGFAGSLGTFLVESMNAHCTASSPHLGASMPHKPRQMQAKTVLQEQQLGRATCSRGPRCADAQMQA